MLQHPSGNNVFWVEPEVQILRRRSLQGNVHGSVHVFVLFHQEAPHFFRLDAREGWVHARAVLTSQLQGPDFTGHQVLQCLRLVLQESIVEVCPVRLFLSGVPSVMPNSFQGLWGHDLYVIVEATLLPECFRYPVPQLRFLCIGLMFRLALGLPPFRDSAAEGMNEWNGLEWNGME